MKNSKGSEMAHSHERKMRDATDHLLDLRRHIITRVDEGYGIVRIGCTVPQHLEALYEEFLHLVGVTRSGPNDEQ